jgi:hypothetical protein
MPRLVEIEVGLREASIREHAWGMGERLQKPIPEAQASVNWTIHGFARWFKERFNERMNTIQDYCTKNEVPLSRGVPYFPPELFHELMGPAQVTYKDNQAIFSPN